MIPVRVLVFFLLYNNKPARRLTAMLILSDTYTATIHDTGSRNPPQRIRTSGQQTDLVSDVCLYSGSRVLPGMV